MMMSHNSMRVAENKFVAECRMEILVEAERIVCPRLGHEGVMSPGAVLFWVGCVGLSGGYVLDKENLWWNYQCLSKSRPWIPS